MPVRIKTVEYAFQSRNATALAAATRYDFSAITVVLPESSKVFRSVRVQVAFRDAVTTATSATSPVVGINIDSVGFSNTTLGNPPANSGESQGFFFERDVTSYFTTNYTGTSHSVQVGVQVSAVTSVNHTAKLIITYEYDDTSASHVKTVRIPLESGTGALTTTLAQIGTNQIPALDTFLPEASKTYRNIWIELIYNDHTGGTTNDSQLGMQVDSGTEHLSAAHESGLGSACSCWYIWDQGSAPVWSTASVHALNLRSTNVTTASTFNHVGIILHVTYTFDPSASTSIINSVMMGLPHISLAGATVTADQSEEAVDLWIAEPGTITLVQSGALVWYSQAAAVGPNVRLGSQATRAYTDVSLLNCGSMFLTQRADSGSAQGAAFTLARGKNTLEWGVFIGTAGTTPGGFGGILYLNYTSDKAPAGPGVHNQTRIFSIQDSQASGNISTIAAAQRMFIPDTHWRRSQLAFLTHNFHGSPTVQFITVEAESVAGELTAGGWEVQGTVGFVAETESGWYPTLSAVGRDAPNDWQRWNNDPDTTRMSLTASRRFKITTAVSGTRPLFALLTFHSITYTISGTVSGSAGGAVTLSLHRSTDGTKLLETTRVGNGAYSFTWHDNSIPVFVCAREDATHVGRSENGTAT